jgi:hypothetical protein
MTNKLKAQRVFDRAKSRRKSQATRLAGIGWLLFGGSSSSFAQSPSAYSAYTGTDVKTIPPAPALGPANGIIRDPTFQSRILRVTDQNTLAGQSFMPTDAGFHRTWNANSTAIKLIGPQGQSYWMDFDPGTFSVGALHPLSFGTAWTWSAVDPNVIYYLNVGTNKIATYDKSPTGGMTDLGGPPNGDPVSYTAVTIGADLWVCSAAGPGQQDTFTKLFCINPTSPSTSKFIDVYNKTINGVAQADPNWPTSASQQVIGIHSIAGGPGSSWLNVTFHQQSWGGNGDAIFDLDTNRWSLVKDAAHGGDNYPSGHTALGLNRYANSAGSQDGRDGRGILVRDPDNVMDSSQYRFVEQPADTNPGWCDSEHISWFNSASNPNAPILQSRYGPDPSLAPNSICRQTSFPWKGEIVAAAVDGSNTVWRFAHNHNGFQNQCGYFGDAFAQISNDGKWASFSSPWDGTLGTPAGFDCSTRVDTFIVELVPATGSSNSSVTDNFDRADGPLGSNWTNQGPGFTLTGEIRSNRLAMESPFTSRRAARYTAVTFAGDHSSQVSVSVLARWMAGAAVRMQSNADTYYAAGFDNNNYSISDGANKCRIWKYLNHVPSSLAVDSSCHVAAGDTLRLEARGSTLRFYQNGALRLTATDTSLSGGSPGFEFAHDVDGSPVLDDWAGADLPP